MDQYLTKIAIDLDEEMLSKVTGKISDEVVAMGKISKEFTDNALETARQYNEEIQRQQRIIEEVDAKLKRGGVGEKDRALLLETKKKAEAQKHKYLFGDEESKLLPQAVVDALAEYAKQTNSVSLASSKVSGVLSAMFTGVAKVNAVIGAATLVVGTFTKSLTSSINKISNYANQLNPLGAFGSQTQRGVMSRYGMSGSTAMGFSESMRLMSIDESQIGSLTPEQRRVFEGLQNFWNEGMGKLDPDALERYTESMSQFQEVQAKFAMGMNMIIMKLVSSSPSFNRLVGRVEDLFDATMDFLGSSVVQRVFDGLVDFLTTVVTLLEKGMRLISKIPGFSSGSNITNNTTNSNTNYNIYGNNFHSNDELARQLSYSTQGNYGG